MEYNATVINIVSGKGGTGKSLLTAVLGRALAREGNRVLIIDLDIFVRGLTILLTESGKRSLRSEGFSISDLLSGTDQSELMDMPAIERFFECDLIPAVKDIGAPFRSSKEQLGSEYSEDKINNLLAQVRNKYDVILLDNRSGLDNAFLSSCKLSDIILSVAEDDEVSLQTNSNLINYLRFSHDFHTIYTVINKGRRIYSYKDLENSSFRKIEFNFIGVIPFDSEVMDDFGTERFWSTVYETLYFRAVIDTWNNIASREGLKEISLKRYRFPPSIFMSPRGGRYALIERMLVLYGAVFTISGVALWVYPRIRYEELTSFDLYAIIAIMMGVSSIILAGFGFRRLLVGQKFPKDRP